MEASEISVMVQGGGDSSLNSLLSLGWRDRERPRLTSDLRQNDSAVDRIWISGAVMVWVRENQLH